MYRHGLTIYTTHCKMMQKLCDFMGFVAVSDWSVISLLFRVTSLTSLRPYDLQQNQMIQNSKRYLRHLTDIHHKNEIFCRRLISQLSLMVYQNYLFKIVLQWRHNERDGISYHWRFDCLHTRLFRHRKHQSSASLLFVRGIHWSPVNSLHKGPVTRKMLPFDEVLMNGTHFYVMQHKKMSP